MIDADRDKLVKILRMFGSDHDGEVASAARRAHELIKARALDWDDLIIQVGRQRAQQHQARASDIDADEATMIHRCSELEMCLTAWEREFIGSISESVIEWGRLTPKQRSVLDRIVNKLKINGNWDEI